MDLLQAHEAMRREKGPLKPAKVDLTAAIAEIQAQIASKDPSFKPANDVRKNASKP